MTYPKGHGPQEFADPLKLPGQPEELKIEDITDLRPDISQALKPVELNKLTEDDLVPCPYPGCGSLHCTSYEAQQARAQAKLKKLYGG